MPTDYKGAFDEFQRFAQGDDAHAQYMLGIMYGLGLGVAQDYMTSIDWYERAAAAGNAPAQCNLGWMYGTGRGVPQDFIQALAWYSLAAASGQDTARQNRDLLNEKMTPNQVEQAQTMARDVSTKMREARA
jgi:uncharacterized protein